MRRDNDLVRTLLFDFEQTDGWLFLVPGTTSNASEEEMKERYHILLMMDQGLVAEVGLETFRLTAFGHDFIDAVRDDGIWARTKRAVQETGGNATLEMIKEISLALLKKKVSDHTGLQL